MRIHADFYSVDDADRAAAALQAANEGIFDISITDTSSTETDRSYTVYASANGTAMSSILPAGGNTASHSVGNGASIDVICRSIEGRRIRGVLINRGGHNIT